MLGRQALLVHSVPGFVKNAEERFVEMPSVVACRDPAITGAETAAEGVRSLIKPPPVQVEANRGGRCLPEHFLTLERIVTRQDLDRRARSRIRDRGHQRGTSSWRSLVNTSLT